MCIAFPGGEERFTAVSYTHLLSRELSGREIARIAAESPIELECFIHGALCMSVSGQCYMSAFLGGRSGNRGSCAGTCRLPFAADGAKEGYHLSLKDLSLVDKIPELMEMCIRDRYNNQQKQ